MSTKLEREKDQNGSVIIFVFVIGLVAGLILSIILESTYHDITGIDSLEVTVYKDFQAQDYKNIPKELSSDYNDWKFEQKKAKFMEKRKEGK